MNGNSIARFYKDCENKQQKRQDEGQEELKNVDVARYECLKEAIARKERGSIVWLLNEGCPVNIPELDESSSSPLHVAVLANDLSTSRRLLSLGAEVNSVNSQKETALHLAFKLRRVELVDELLRGCDGRSNPSTSYGLSHFHISCVRNAWAVAHGFLQRGLNASVHLEKCFYGEDYLYYRPLHLAVGYESFEVAELLLTYGANVNARDRYKRSPLHLAARYNYKRLLQELAAAPAPRPRLIDLLRRKNDQLDILMLLLRFGADVNALDASLTPVLFHCFNSDYLEIKSQLGCSQLDTWPEVVEAIKAVQRDKFYTLLEFGANAAFSTDGKETLLHLVIDDGRRLLSRSRAGLNDEDKAEMVNILLENGAEIEGKNAKGQSPLQLAIAGYYARTVEVLLKHRANVASISFMHYKVPRPGAGSRRVTAAGSSAAGLLGYSFQLAEMEAFLDIIRAMLERKSELGLSCSNELLVLRYLARDYSSSSLEHLENCELGELSRLLDFSELDKINLACCLSESSILANRERIGLVLEHVQKLQLAGLLQPGSAVSRSLRSCASSSGLLSLISARFARALVDRCNREIGKMRASMVDRYASFYDLMFLNVNDIAARVKSPDFRRAVKCRCTRDFKLYGNIVIKQFLNGLLRSILLDSAKDYLTFILERHLPEPCLENILGHLTNEDLCNLAFAFVKC